METYRYEGIDRKGAPVRGEAAGASPYAVSAALRADGIITHSIKAPAAGPSQFRRQRALRPEDLNLFSTQLAALARSGMPLAPALEALARESRGRAFQRVLEAVRHGVEGGQSLEEALERHNGAFPPLYVNLIRVGERTGNLPAVLQQLSAYGQRHVAFRNQLIVALAYPAFLLGALLLFLGIFVPAVLGQFEALYHQMGVELPQFTAAVLGVGRSLLQFGLPGLGVCALLGAILWAGGGLFVQGELRRRLDRFVLRMPVFGPMAEAIVTARFLHALAMLLHNGAPIVEALQLAGAASGNRHVIVHVSEAAAAVAGGEGIADAINESGILRRTQVWMMRQGERSTDFPGALRCMAESADKDVELQQRALIATLGPALVALCGIFVGLAVIACFLPIFGISGAVQG